ncbi:MAG: hypothetical protein HY077_08530 [Elusimicrobia bacterium]|nr:hypothetical protein [Elusimicrobiota bacterium]
MLKHLALPVGMVAMVLAVMLFGFWRVASVENSDAALELSAKVEALAADWAAKNLPMQTRTVVLVISDGAVDADVLSLGADPTTWDRLKVWLGRAYGPRRRAGSVDSRFVKAYSADANTIAWTHEGYATASQKQMTRDITRAILKAHDAGAELDIVAQGLAAAPVLMAIKGVEGQVRGGERVGVNKLVAIGMSRDELAKIDPAFFTGFGRPSNLLEWSNVWQDPARKTTIEFFGGSQNGTVYAAEDLYPGWTGATADAAGAARELAAPGAVMERILGQRAQAAQARIASAAKPAESAPSPQTQDSLSMIGGGSGYSVGTKVSEESPRIRSPGAECMNMYESKGACAPVCPESCRPYGLMPGKWMCLCRGKASSGLSFDKPDDCRYACAVNCDVLPGPKYVCRSNKQ